MKDEQPKIIADEMYHFLRDGKIKEFNERKARGGKCDLRGVDLRGLDLRGMDVDGIDFSNSYFRLADLRGLNFSTCKLEGASIANANISGVLFPKELSSEEIRLSLECGTRMRYKHT
jgi:uncharacterized protein YjbI with pentapeptide repeats